MEIDKMDATEERSRDDPQGRTAETHGVHAEDECGGDSADESGEDAAAKSGKDDPYRKICELILLCDEFLRQCDECARIVEEERRRERLMKQLSWCGKLKSMLERVKLIYNNQLSAMMRATQKKL
jgi:hypothetical protein